MTSPARWVPLLLLAVAFLVVPVGSQPQAQATSPMADISSHLWAEMQAQGEADVLIVLRERADLRDAAQLPTRRAQGHFVFEMLRSVARRSQAPLVAYLRARGVPYQAFYLVNMVRVRGDRELLLELAARSDVARLEANPRVRADLPLPSASGSGGSVQAEEGVPWGIERVRADEVWAMGIRGKGVVVAGNDTGIFWRHEALKERYRGWDGEQAHHDSHWHDAVNHQAVPYDDHGHGTLTLGTVVGRGGESERIGMAPEARWIGCKNMDSAGFGTPTGYIECFEFFLAPYPHGGDPMADGDPARAPDVINNSWYCPPAEGCGPETLQEAVEALRAAGIVIVTSVGNSGPACSTVTDPPETYEAAFSVGAFADGDTIAGFSSRGPVIVDGSNRLKPDVAAPGVSIRSCQSNGGYGSGSGTSMAAPHVAGQVALMLSANPQLRGQVDAIEDLIVQTTDPKTATAPCGGEPPDALPNNTWGYGIINAVDAVWAALAWTPGTPTSTPTPSSTPTRTATATPTPSSKPTFTATATATPTPTAMATPTSTATPLPGWSAYLPILWYTTEKGEM